MKCLRLVSFALLTIFITASVFAQATRTWVSGVGDDANPCSRTAPCKTFAGAISKTAAGGIINVLDPGGFGAVTITKSMTIDGTPYTAGVLASGTQGIVINGSGINVILRGLDIEGAGTTNGTNGINVINAAKVVIDRCNVTQFSSHGVLVGVSNPVAVAITNSHIYQNGGDGVSYIPSSGTPAVTGSIDNSIIAQNANGVYASNGARINISQSVISNNSTGIRSEAVSGTTLLTVSQCRIVSNVTGATTVGGANAFIRLEMSTLQDNPGSEYTISAGQIFTYVDNYVGGGGTPTGTLTVVGGGHQ